MGHSLNYDYEGYSGYISIDTCYRAFTLQASDDYFHHLTFLRTHQPADLLLQTFLSQTDRFQTE